MSWPPIKFEYDPYRAHDKRSYQGDALAEARHFLFERHDHFLLDIATGGGKTWVAIQLVLEALAQGLQVLWLAPDWLLADQACAEFCQRTGDGHELVGRFGPPQGSEIRVKRKKTRLVFSTLPTMRSRITDADPKLPEPDLVVWDECHWAFRSPKTGGRLKRWMGTKKAVVLGLSATFGRHEGYFKGRFSRSFNDLVRSRHLAQPLVVEPHRTGFRWEPRLLSDQFLARDSIVQLIDTPGRDESICRFFVKHERKFGKTLIFAGTTDQANRLVKILNSPGVVAEAVHSKRDPAENREALRKLMTDDLSVVVGVNMLTRGVDVRDIKTIVMACPTTSPVRYLQMVGRGARFIKGVKEDFQIVDIVDNATRHGDLLIGAAQVFGPPKPRPSGGPGGRTKPVRVFPAPSGGKARWIPKEHELPSLRGLWIREGHSFGVELELTRADFEDDEEDDWVEVADALTDALRQAELRDLVLDYWHDNDDYRSWQVIPDATAGWEVVSPVLEGVEGLVQLAEACSAIDLACPELGLKVDHRTGTHVHFAWRPGYAPERRPMEYLVRSIRLARLFEAGAGSLVAPSRLLDFDGRAYDRTVPNQYAQPTSSVFPSWLLEPEHWSDLEAVIDEHSNRYSTVNFVRTNRPSSTATVEVRMHSGTTDPSKLALWISLWMQILFAAGERLDDDLVEPDDIEGTLHPEDLMPLVQRWLPAQAPEGWLFRDRLIDRREEIVREWSRAGLTDWVEGAAHWTQRPKRRASLRLETDGSHRRILLEGERISIGRGPFSDILIQGDNQVSGEHCHIVCLEGRWQIQDANSTNGTIVDGRYVTRATLTHGVRIDIGASRLVFHLE